jgi:nickel transport protein
MVITSRPVLPTMLAALLLLLFAGPAHAHRVNIFAWVEGQTVHTESKFSGGKRVVAGTVEVYDRGSGTKLLSGTTDKEGRFSFPLPQGVRQNPAGLRIAVIAGMGHQNDWLLSPEELGGSAAPSPVPAPASSAAKELPPSPSPDSGGDTEELRRILEETLDRKLAPLQQRLNAMEQSGPGATEIFGGIGYIVGLVGIGLFLRSRRK